MSEKKSDKSLTYEQAVAQMEAIAAAIEEGKIGLEQTIQEYEKAIKLHQHCRAILTDAEAKIQQLELSENGTLEPKPMPPPADADV